MIRLSLLALAWALAGAACADAPARAASTARAQDAQPRSQASQPRSQASQPRSQASQPGPRAQCDAALETLARAGASVDDRERAARLLWKSCERPLSSSTEQPLHQLASEGTSEAAVWLLLRDFPTARTRALLERASRQRESKRIKLGMSGPVVDVTLAIAIASGTGLGDRAASVADREFVLAAIAELSAADDLRRVVGFLDDEREARGGAMPSGMRPRQRVCDLAVNALAVRLGWSPGPFALSEAGRYDAHQLSAARAHFLGAIR